MSGRYLLDTNIVIALFADDSRVLDHLQKADETFIPNVVIGELYYGAQKSARVTENMERIGKFVAKSAILACDEETAAKYGEVKHKLRQKGRPIPENDIWIAALALQHSLILVTRDAHFNEVDGLTVENW